MTVSESPKIDLLNIDCMEYMAGVPDKHFDLAIVDPPYAVGASDGSFGNRGHDSKTSKLKHYANADKTPDSDYFSELYRISKNQIIWGANYYPKHFEHSGWIVWHKKEYGPLSDCELAYQSIDKVVKYFRHDWFGFMKKNNGESADLERIHPNQKPISLYKWLLKNYAKEGDKILDTHGGSMSSAIACHQMGFDLTLCELDKDYYEAGVKRFKEQTMQQDLFKQVI